LSHPWDAISNTTLQDEHVILPIQYNQSNTNAKGNMGSLFFASTSCECTEKDRKKKKRRRRRKKKERRVPTKDLNEVDCDIMPQNFQTPNHPWNMEHLIYINKLKCVAI
jgi:hypothetical protein